VATVSLYLDSNAFITFLEGQPSGVELLGSLFEVLRRRPGAGITSELTLGEVLAGSHKGGPRIKRAYLDLIIWSKLFQLTPVTRDVLYEGADLCVFYRRNLKKKLTLPDAIHLATAIKARCRYFVSEDKGIIDPKGMVKVGLDANAISDVCKALG
jgi:predicted nucleic acid-binding protein